LSWDCSDVDLKNPKDLGSPSSEPGLMTAPQLKCLADLNRRSVQLQVSSQDNQSGWSVYVKDQLYLLNKLLGANNWKWSYIYYSFKQ